MNTCKTCQMTYDPRISQSENYCSDRCQKKGSHRPNGDQGSQKVGPNVNQVSHHPSSNPYNENTTIYYMQLNDLRGQIEARDHQIRRDRDELDRLRADNFKLRLENATAEEKKNIALERIELDKDKALSERPKSVMNGIAENPAIIEGLGKVAETLAPLVTLFVNKNEEKQSSASDVTVKIESTLPETQEQIDGLMDMVRTKKDVPEAISALYNLAIFQEWLPEEVQKAMGELNNQYQQKVQQLNETIENQP